MGECDMQRMTEEEIQQEYESNIKAIRACTTNEALNNAGMWTLDNTEDEFDSAVYRQRSRERAEAYAQMIAKFVDR